MNTLKKPEIRPRLKLVGGPIWKCFDKHVERKGNGPKQAYDRWMHAALKSALRAARIAPGRPTQPLPAREDNRPAEFGSVEQAASAIGVALPETKEAFRALLDSLDLTAEADQRACVSLIGLAPAYSARQVQQVGAPVPIRPAYSTPAGLRLNQARALADQPALTTISTHIERTAP